MQADSHKGSRNESLKKNYKKVKKVLDRMKNLR